ncbi:MAG: hypothetical protein HYW25_03530 [Candidatus Aenigmarchaeota archaeon]|nr:hypothetical protein [Candidatus Aenigmarchaeota archaeon]
MDRLFMDVGKLALLAVIFGGTLAFAAGAAFADELPPIGVDPFINCAELDPIWSSWDTFYWCHTGGGVRTTVIRYTLILQGLEFDEFFLFFSLSLF